MATNKKIDSKEGAKQVAKNVTGAAVGTGLGYIGMGLLAKAALKNPKVMAALSKKTPAELRQYADYIRYGGGLVGTIGGYVAANEVQKALNSEKDSHSDQEKVANFFINYAFNRLL